MHGETIDRASTPARTSAASPRAVAGVMVALVAASIAPFLVGALSVQMGATFPFTTSDVALGVAGYYLVSAVVSPVGGRVVDAMGPTRALRLAGVGSTAGLVLIAIADSAAAVVAALALLGLPNSLLQPASNQVLAVARTARRQGLSFGLVQSAIPVATLLSGVLLGTVGDDSSWRSALWLVVGLSLAGQLVLAGRLPSTAPVDDCDPETRGERLVGGPLLMGALVLGGLLGSMAAMTLTAFAAATGQHAGFGSQTVAFAQVVGSLLCVVVRVAATWRGSELAGPQLLFLIVCLLALGSGGYVLVGSATALTFTLGVALAYGCGWGWTALFNLSLTRVRPSRIAASTGLTQAGIFCGGVAGPLAFAAIVRDAGYDAAWSAMAVVAVAAAVLLGFAGRRWSRAQQGPVSIEGVELP